MSSFSPYEKMPRNLRKANARNLTMIEKKKWVVTEKIHGANFSFVYNNGSIRFARRRAYLDWKESFFGFQSIAADMEERIQAAFDEIALFAVTEQVAENNEVKIIIYGELFGGGYPQLDVDCNKVIKPVQTGVYYSPDLCFCAFDIAVETTSSKQYLPYEQCILLFEKHNIFYAKPLLIGSLTEALNFNTRIDSTIPEALGLPHLTPNLIEGVVVKLYSEGSQATSRFIFKSKNTEFDEDEEYRQSERWYFVPEVESLSVQTVYVVSDCIRMVTPVRLSSAISKVGNFHDNPLGVKDEVRFDIFASLRDIEALESLSPKERQWVERRIDAAVDLLLLRAPNHII